jgi:hypothetical protein
MLALLALRFILTVADPHVVVGRDDIARLKSRIRNFTSAPDTYPVHLTLGTFIINALWLALGQWLSMLFDAVPSPALDTQPTLDQSPAPGPRSAYERSPVPTRRPIPDPSPVPSHRITPDPSPAPSYQAAPDPSPAPFCWPMTRRLNAAILDPIPEFPPRRERQVMFESIPTSEPSPTRAPVLTREPIPSGEPILTHAVPTRELVTSHEAIPTREDVPTREAPLTVGLWAPPDRPAFRHRVADFVRTAFSPAPAFITPFAFRALPANPRRSGRLRERKDPDFKYTR